MTGKALTPAFVHRARVIAGGILVAAIVSVVAGGTAAAAEPRPVTFCFNNWPPFTEMGPKGADGISVAIIKEAARRLKIAVEFRELPWNRCLHSVKTGETDAAIDAAKRPEFLQGPTSFSIYSDTFWVRLDSGFLDTADLKGRSVGLVNGYSYDEKLSAKIDTLGMVREFAVDDPTNIRKLAFGRVDAAVGDLIGTLHFARTRELAVRPFLPPVSLDRLYVSFNSDRAAIHRRFDRMFKKLLADGFVDAVYTKRLGESINGLLAAN